MRNFTKEEVIKAIRGSAGIIQAIASRLDCTWRTARSYIRKWKATQEAIQEEKETILDYCETYLVKSIQEGNLDTIKWYLNYQGRQRGYDTKQEVAIEADTTTTLRVIEVPDFALPDDVKEVSGADKIVRIKSKGNPFLPKLKNGKKDGE